MEFTLSMPVKILLQLSEHHKEEIKDRMVDHPWGWVDDDGVEWVTAYLGGC